MEGATYFIEVWEQRVDGSCKMFTEPINKIENLQYELKLTKDCGFKTCFIWYIKNKPLPDKTIITITSCAVGGD